MWTRMLSFELWSGALLPLLFAAILAALVCLLGLGKSERSRTAFYVVFSMSLLGIVTGQLTGQSREAAIGAVLPAVLGLIGGVSVFLFATKEAAQQLMASVSVALFAFNLLVGGIWGAVIREQYERDQYERKQYEAHAGSLDARLARVKEDHEVRLQQLLYDKQFREVEAALKSGG